MPSDEDLRRRFETLTDRIREEVMRQLAAATDDLMAAVEADRAAAAQQAAADARASADQDAAARLSDAVAAAEERGRQSGQAEGREVGTAAGRQQGRADALAETRAAQLAAGERLVEGVRAIDRARSLSEILDALASSASREVARVGVLLVRGGQLRGWRFIGFDPAIENANQVELPLANAGVIEVAVNTKAAASADSGSSPSPWEGAALPPGREMLAVPVPMSGEIVAVLYADQGADEPADRDQSEPSSGRPASLEILVRHATRCLESITAIRAAQVLRESANDTPAPQTESFAAPAARSAALPDRVDNPEDEEQAARRYARLLISEIRLYHEDLVFAGRRDRDLSARLGGEIARARVLYEQRVPPHVRGETDYFHDELVRTLANGDPSLLGQTA